MKIIRNKSIHVLIQIISTDIEIVKHNYKYIYNIKNNKTLALTLNLIILFNIFIFYLHSLNTTLDLGTR